MIDREKVIKGLECCLSLSDDFPDECLKCPYVSDMDSEVTCMRKMGSDALALLKEQEPVKPCVATDTWICPKCGHTLESQYLIDDKENPQVLVHEQYNFCPNCGRAVKWDD